MKLKRRRRPRRTDSAGKSESFVHREFKLQLRFVGCNNNFHTFNQLLDRDNVLVFKLVREQILESNIASAINGNLIPMGMILFVGKFLCVCLHITIDDRVIIFAPPSKVNEF